MILRSTMRSLVRNRFFASCWVMRRAALHDAEGARVRRSCARIMPMTSMPKCSKKRRSSVASTALIRWFGKSLEWHRIRRGGCRAARPRCRSRSWKVTARSCAFSQFVPADFAEGRDGQGQHAAAAPTDTERQQFGTPARRRRAWPRGPAAGPCARNTAPRGSTARVRLRSARRRSRSRMLEGAHEALPEPRACPGNPTKSPVGCEIAVEALNAEPRHDISAKFNNPSRQARAFASLFAHVDSRPVTFPRHRAGSRIFAMNRTILSRRSRQDWRKRQDWRSRQDRQDRRNRECSRRCGRSAARGRR